MRTSARCLIVTALVPVACGGAGAAPVLSVPVESRSAPSAKAASAAASSPRSPAGPVRPPRAGEPASREVLVRMERTPACLVRDAQPRPGGPCPAYVVTVYGDGRVRWDGKWDVRVLGGATVWLEPAQLDELRRAFRDAGFFALLDKYDCSERTTQKVVICTSDEASATLTFRDGDQEKTVFHDYGDSQAPPLLEQLERRVDEVVTTSRWIQ